MMIYCQFTIKVGALLYYLLHLPCLFTSVIIIIIENSCSIDPCSKILLCGYIVHILFVIVLISG